MKLWGSVFRGETSSLMEEFNESISFDKELYSDDIEGSLAHAAGLNKAGILTDKEFFQITEGLIEIKKEIESGDLSFSIKHEDIHMNIEVLLTEKIGALGKKLHTARSRNDQVAVDLRMYLRKNISDILELLLELMNVLLESAEGNMQVIMPGYTHLQRAQPVRLSFHLMAYLEMFKRDYIRLENCLLGLDVMPLGSGALSGMGYDIDRDYVAGLLGFNDISLNAMDAVSDRDYAIEFLSAASIIGMHISRLSEEMVLFNTSEYAFISISDSYATGSSIMPQKRNPDAFELLRGKTGRLYGNLMSLLVVMKGLPLAYNKDMQEDKESVFDSVKTIKQCLKVLAGAMKDVTWNSEKMLEATKKGFMSATDVADYLAKKGMPFRLAHEVTGKIVSYCMSEEKVLDGLSVNEYKKFSDLFEEDILEKVDVKRAVEAKVSSGSTSMKSVWIHIKKSKEWMNEKGGK